MKRANKSKSIVRQLRDFEINGAPLLHIRRELEGIFAESRNELAPISMPTVESLSIRIREENRLKRLSSQISFSNSNRQSTAFRTLNFDDNQENNLNESNKRPRLTQ